MGSGAPARFRPPQAVINRQVVATQRPAPPRQPFEQRQATINMRTERPNQAQPLNQGTAGGTAAGTHASGGKRSNARPGNAATEARPQRPILRPSPYGLRRRRRRVHRRAGSRHGGESSYAGLVASPGTTRAPGTAKERSTVARRREQIPQLAATAPAVCATTEPAGAQQHQPATTAGKPAEVVERK